MAEKHHSGGTRGSHGGKPQQTAVPKIKEALNFMRNHSFEVPFIANYRREYVEPELDVYDLWKIYQWDEKVVCHCVCVCVCGCAGVWVCWCVCVLVWVWVCYLCMYVFMYLCVLSFSTSLCFVVDAAADSQEEHAPIV